MPPKHTLNPRHSISYSQITPGSHRGVIFLPPHLLAPVGEARVPSNPALEVELALPMSTEVNGAGLDVDVHQVINNPALDVILNPVDQEPPANIDDFDERKFPGDRQTDSHSQKQPRELSLSM